MTTAERVAKSLRAMAEEFCDNADPEAYYYFSVEELAEELRTQAKLLDGKDR